MPHSKRTEIQRLKGNIEHRTPNTEHSTFNIQHSTFNIQVAAWLVDSNRYIPPGFILPTGPGAVAAASAD
jgi:hypothetical protein